MQSLHHTSSPLNSEKHNFELDSNQKKPSDPLEKPLFSPFLADSLGVLDFAFASYCQRHHMIIAVSSDSMLRFYDATTLQALKERKIHKLSYVIAMVYSDETDTFLFGCRPGSIYAYNASNDELKLLRKEEKTVKAVAFVNEKSYVYSMENSYGLFIGNLDNENVHHFDMEQSYITCLYQMSHKKFLLVGLKSGCVKIFDTKRVPHLQSFSLVKTHKNKRWVTGIQGINVKGHEYLMMTSEDLTVRIWCWIKGRLRLLRVIPTKQVVTSLVYLGNYKMIAVGYEQFECIAFVKLLSGKVEKQLNLDYSPTGLFLMKDKNMVGCLSVNGLFDSSVELVQLHPKIEKNSLFGELA